MIGGPRSLALVAMSAAAGLAPSCASNPAATERTVAEARGILEQSARALGGLERLRADMPTRVRSHVSLYQGDQFLDDGVLTVERAPGGKERVCLELRSGHSLLQVCDGTRAAAWEDGQPTGSDLELEVRRRERYRKIVPLFLEESIDPPATVIDREDSQSGRRIVVQRLLGDEVWQLSIDADTGLLCRILCSSRVDSSRLIQEDLLSDYSAVQDRPIPFRTVTQRNGVRVRETRLLSWEEGVELPADHFSLADPTPR